MEKEEKKYCGFCGKEMLKNLIGAETNMIRYCPWDYGGASLPFASAYNVDTGERQYCRVYVCPDWKNSFFNSSPHDRYIVNKIVTL